MKNLSRLLGVGVLACTAVPSSVFAQDAGITGDADIPGKPTPNVGIGFFDISGNGSTIAGVLRVDATTYRAYRITASGYEALPGIDGDAYVLANGVSDDGTVIAGLSAATYISRSAAVVWEGTSMTTLAHLNPTAGYSQSSAANGVSGDGAVIVGSSATSTGATHAVRWVNKGTPEDLNGDDFVSSIALRASRDGRVVAGYGGNATYTNEAFVWTQNGGMVGLGVLPADVGTTYAKSRATDVSADGNVVVGFSAGHGNGDDMEAFRWTSGGGMTGLGLLSGGTHSRAYAVNADGTVIVGSATQPGTYVAQELVAFRWTQSGGMQTVSAWLTANGVSVGSNTFTDATGVSDDGNVVIGTGQINGTTQQYIARVAASTGGGDNPGDGGTGGGDTGGGDTGGGDTGGGDNGGGDNGGGDNGGLIGLVDYLYTVSNNGGVTFQNLINGANVILFGAHHRPLLDYAGNGRTCGWITGDYAESNRNNRRNVSGEAGICHDLAEGVRIGFGGGADGIDLDTSFGGQSKADGYHLVGELDVQPQGMPLIFSLTGYYADWNVSLARAYQNGTGIDVSRSKTDARAWALRGRADWRDMVRLGKDVSLSSYAAFSHIHVGMDGYTETGGAFPLAMNAMKSNTDEMRLGGILGANLADKVRLQISGEWVHRFDPTAAPLTGTILGVGGFAVAGAVPEQDWGRAGLDLDFGLSSRTMLSFSGHAMLGHGDDARLGGSASLRFNF
ncbi:probable extracellular repeat, HAF family [Novosphingobium sp. CF614]|uniref:autotransporter domain-containing protein n=1 Tax=Novosphingobium sp. CF614 TaxID=1884364 RepID=UPI0008E37700|nr:autotransporter domain-containing protein [Novosphingobium sp. CF614]SFG24495.1 probable extracellular repeat, HAF family [Novosphingobium sp. CF614]